MWRLSGAGLLAPQIARSVEHARQFLWRVDIRRGTCCRATGMMRHFMLAILRVEEAGKERDLLKPPLVTARGRRDGRRPGDRGLAANVSISPVDRITRERGEVSGRLCELEAERAAQLDVAINIIDQHGDLPGQGCATAASSAISTLA